jgi:hypothetical protein
MTGANGMDGKKRRAKGRSLAVGVPTQHAPICEEKKNCRVVVVSAALDVCRYILLYVHVSGTVSRQKRVGCGTSGVEKRAAGREAQFARALQ